MKAARWLVLLGAILALVGLFLPAVRVQGALGALSKRGAISFYTAFTNEEFLTAAARRYDHASHGALATAIAHHLAPHGGRLGDLAATIRSTLGDVGDASDAAKSGALGTAILIAGWLFLSLVLSVGLYGLTAASGQRLRRRGAIVAATLAGLAMGIAAGVFWAAGEAVDELNDEFGHAWLGRGFGVHLMILGMVVAVTAAVAIAVLTDRVPAPITAVPLPGPGPVPPTDQLP
jgi:hypothetical protein